MLRTLKQYLQEEMDLEMPEGLVSGSWFAEHGLPMIVGCYDCTATMALPYAMIDEDGHCFCRSCAGVDT